MAENRDEPPLPLVREAVASFADKGHLRRAVGQLLAAGFKPDDLSLLADHDSLEIAGGLPGYRGKPGSTLLAGLTNDVVIIMPLTIAGLALLSGGPVAVALAALASGGLGGAALKELLDYVTANRHSAEFAAALEAGAVLLWARVDDSAREATALRILDEAGGRQAHVHARPLHLKR